MPLRGLAAFPRGYLLPWPMPRRSQSLMVRSHPAVARRRPSGENATPRACGACARRVTNSLACGNPQSRIAFLAPTFTYLAYGNVGMLEQVRRQLGQPVREFYQSALAGPAAGRWLLA